MHFSEFISTKIKDFPTQVAEELDVKDNHTYEVQFIDRFRNFAKLHTVTRGVGMALRNAITQAFNDKKIIGFPSLAYALKAITNDVTKFDVKVKDLTLGIIYKYSSLKLALKEGK